MRRTTLGPISSSQLNTRQAVLSNPSARVSVGAPKPTAMARQSVGALSGASSRRVSAAPRGARRPPTGPRNSSMARQSSGARSSTGLSGRRSSSYSSRASLAGRGGSLVKDPRPLNDRAFMNNCIQMLVEFLTDRQYDQQLPPKLLRGPSKKDFANIVQFLFRQVDPSFEFSNNNRFEEEVAMQFRNLRYPFTISKTALTACGTPHTWPTLLGSLSWLVELLSYDEITQNSSVLDEDDGENGDKTFFKYLDASYRVFLAGEDDKFAVLEEQERAKHVTRNEAARQETEELEKQRDELKKRIEQATRAKNSLPLLNQKNADCISDLEKFRSMVAQVEECNRKLKKRIEKYNAEHIKVDKQKAARSHKIQELRTQIEEQELSADDIENISKERARLNDQIYQIQDRQKDMQAMIWREETSIAQQRDKLEAEVQKYSVVCTDLKLLPSSAKNAFGVDYDIVLDAHTGGVAAAQELTAHLKQHIRPSLAAFKQNRVERGCIALDEGVQLQEHVQINRETLDLEKQQEQNWESQAKKLDDALRREREVRDEAIEEKAAETEEVELQIESILNERDSATEEAQTRQHLANVEKALTAMTESYRQLLQKNHHKVENVLMACINHKSMVERTIASLETEVDSIQL